MALQCDVTKKNKEDMGGPPREGAYVHGLFMEGARWDLQTGMINEARLKELAPPDAGYLHQGDPGGPHGLEEHLRVSGVQDEAARTDLRVDLQPQVQGEAGSVGAGRCGAPPPSINVRHYRHSWFIKNIENMQNYYCSVLATEITITFRLL